MEIIGSPPHFKVTATCIYPESNWLISYSEILRPENPFYYHHPI
jgi:hypothetical protein